MAGKQFYRSHDAYLGGICAGIAEALDVDAIIVRIFAVLIAGATLGLAAIAYVVMWMYVPLKPDEQAPYDVVPASVESGARGKLDASSTSPKLRPSDSESSGMPLLARVAIAVGLPALFLVVALNVAPMVPGSRWWQFWPVAFIIIGLCLIIIPVKNRWEMTWHAVGIVVTSLSASLLPMSLGLVSWDTFPVAFGRLWIVVGAAVCLFVVGIVKSRDSYVLIAAFCLAAFCLAALYFFAVPGDVATLVLNMPNGKAFFVPTGF